MVNVLNWKSWCDQHWPYLGMWAYFMEVFALSLLPGLLLSLLILSIASIVTIMVSTGSLALLHTITVLLFMVMLVISMAYVTYTTVVSIGFYLKFQQLNDTQLIHAICCRLCTHIENQTRLAQFIREQNVGTDDLRALDRDLEGESGEAVQVDSAGHGLGASTEAKDVMSLSEAPPSTTGEISLDEDCSDIEVTASVIEDSPESARTETSTQSFCVICQDAEKTTVLLPCRHLCLCNNCALVDAIRECPLCRSQIESRLRIFS